MAHFIAAWRICAFSVLIVLLSACGGGGGGGSTDTGTTNTGNSGGNPPVASDTPNSYLPTDPSIKWIYNGGTQVSFLPDAVTSGVNIHALLYPTGGKEYFVTASDQISLMGLYLPSISVGDGINYTGDIHFNNSVTVLSNNGVVGTSAAVNGSGTIYISPTYGSRTLNYSGFIQYVSDEAVSTALGTFTAKRININLTLNTTVEGQMFSVPYNVTFWFAKDAGIVKRAQENVIYLLSSVSGININSALNSNSGGTDPGLTLVNLPGGTSGSLSGNDGSGSILISSAGNPIPQANYFPVNRNYYWYYDSNNIGYAYFFSRTLDGMAVDGWSYNYNSPGEDDYVVSPAGVSIKGFFKPPYTSSGYAAISGVFDQLLPVWDNSWSTPRTLALSGNVSVEVSNDALTIPTSQSSTIPFSGSVQYLGDEILTVGSKNLATKHVLLDVAMDVDGYALYQHSSYTFHYILNLWLADGVGIVRWGDHVLSSTVGFPDSDNDGIPDWADQSQ